MSAPSIPALPACMSEIRRKRFEYEGRFGRAPEAIYLGLHDAAELWRYLDHFGDAGRKLGQFDGIGVKVLLETRHVGVGS